MKMKIYTKTGDKGMTSIVGGKRVSKTDPRLESYGTVDELNAILGLTQALLDREGSEFLQRHKDLKNWLTHIQNRLFNLGSLLACEDAALREKLPSISEEDVLYLERAIDHAQERLPELRDFILPGGHLIAAYLHVARTVCRRAERQTLHIATTEAGPVDDVLVRFLNRLSDFLFAASRYANFLEGIEDTKWTKD